MNPRTQMSGFIASLTALAATGFLLPYLFYLPSATLSAVIFMAVLALLQELPHDLGFMWRVRAWRDMMLLATTFIITIFFSLEIGTGVAVFFSLIITIKQSSYPRITIMVFLTAGPQTIRARCLKLFFFVDRAGLKKPCTNSVQSRTRKKR